MSDSEPVLAGQPAELDTNTPRVRSTGGRLPPAAAIGLTTVLALIVFLEPPARGLFWNAFFDFGHAPLFGAIALLVRHVLARIAPSRTARAHAVGAFLATVAVGIATEYLQHFQVGRDESWADVARDAAGAAGFLLLHAASGPRAGDGAQAGRSRSRGLALAGVGALLGAALPFLYVLGIYAARHHAVPTLYRLDGSWWEQRLVDPGRNTLDSNALTVAAPDGAAIALARVRLQPELYSGIGFVAPYPDWSRFQRLVLTTYSTLPESIRLTLRIHDAKHDQRYADRFNRQIVVNPGLNRIEIPLAEVRGAPDRREMDLQRISGIALFASHLTAPLELYLGPIRLE